MTDTWRVIYSKPARGAWNMAVDEAVMESSGRGDTPPTLRLYGWDPACLSLGYAQSYSDVDTNRLQARGWEVVRRVTGGRAILHVDELTYSIAAPTDEIRFRGTILESYHRLAEALILAVHTLGLPVQMEENVPPSNSPKGPVCFEVPSAYEIVIHGKKIIGSAQARKKEGILQHGTFPLIGDLSRITQVLAFPDEKSRETAAQKLLSRAVTAQSILNTEIPWQTAAAAFSSAFEKSLGIELQEGDLTSRELERADELMKIKYDHPAWTERS